MRRRIFVAALTLVCLTLCVSGQAAVSKLAQYTLIVDGKNVPLGKETGYLYRNGGAMMVPVEALCDVMMLKCTVTDKKSALIEGANGTKVSVQLGSKKAKVNGRSVPMRVKVARQDGQLLTADVKLLGMLGAKYKHYAPAVARASGYASGALVVDTTGVGLELPALTTGDELPQAANEAAKTATQIVVVEYKSGSSARLTYYAKASGVWSKQFSVPAYVGKNGIGKTREGDKRTPTGTFNLTQPFGIKADPGTGLGEYVKVTKYHYWSGASGTDDYNKLMDTRQGYKPTSNDEHLIDYKTVYNYCMFIDYNKNGAAGKGSAIFLHCKGSQNYTGGCVAVKESVVVELLRTLKPGAKIVIY